MCYPSSDSIIELVQKHGYEMKEQIGRGQFGRAYRISSLKYSEDFVLKFIPIRNTRSIEDQKAEYEALIQFIHPNILSIYEVWEELGGISLVTEYCNNGSYDKIIRQNGPLPKAKFVPVAKQLLLALQYLHKKGYSHNDIKPANILVDKYGRPKLADFGLCALSDGNKSETVVRGTTLTMAPELFKRIPYNPLKSDIWSMGITLFIMAVGTNPWGENEKDVCFGAVSGIVEYPHDINKQIFVLLDKMLQPNPDDRPEIAELLELPIFKSQYTNVGIPKSNSSLAFVKLPIVRNISKISFKRNGLDISVPTFSV